MYSVLGSDGRPYGPASLETLRAWVLEERVNAYTLVQMAGTSDWKPLATIPELATILPVATPPPRLTRVACRCRID